jgi:3-oxoacyl-[acyl-carrier protein] reductase
MILKKLSNKVAVITGAARGIGSAIAKRFAAEGAVVVINYASRKEDAERTMAAIQAKGGVAITFQADITKASAVEQLFTAANERFGRIDILVNNAALDDFARARCTFESDHGGTLSQPFRGECVRHAASGQGSGKVHGEE